MKVSNYVVYWVRLTTHLDINNEGYVGVAKDFERRMKMHRDRTSKLNTHFGNAIVKYNWDNLVKTIVFTGTKEECYCKEKELRSAYQIGWNEAIGGEGGDTSIFIDYKSRKHIGWNYDKSGNKNPFFNKKHSDESKCKMSSSKATVIVKTPEGVFDGYNAVARFYKINKITAKKWSGKKSGWSYESK